MKREFSIRERWLLTVVPGLAIFAAYLFGFYRPMSQFEAAARAKLTAAAAAPVSDTQVAAKRQAVRELEDRIDILSRAVGAGTSASAPSPQAEAEAVARITDILGRCDVVVVSSARVGEGDGGSMLPPGLGEAIKRLPNAPSGGVWRVEALADFGDLSASLQAMAAQEGLVVPLGISMEPADDGSQHRWSIWIWM
jgi:hypothetical protein